jgi:hypothetical protein
MEEEHAAAGARGEKVADVGGAGVEEAGVGAGGEEETRLRLRRPSVRA